jgi:hypothetical protein
LFGGSSQVSVIKIKENDWQWRRRSSTVVAWRPLAFHKPMVSGNEDGKEIAGPGEPGEPGETKEP